MEFKQIVETRRTRKEFDQNHSMPDEDLNYIINAARNTPTSFNMQNWRFVAIRDRGIKEKIKRAAWNQAQVGINSVLIAVCADLNAWNDDPQRYWAANGTETATYMANMTKEFYGNRPEIQRDEAMRSVGMSATAIMFAATDLGYSCSPMIGFDADAVAQAINAPQGVVVGMLIAIGQSTQDPYPKTKIDLAEILKYDFFPS